MTDAVAMAEYKQAQFALERARENYFMEKARGGVADDDRPGRQTSARTAYGRAQLTVERAAEKAGESVA